MIFIGELVHERILTRQIMRHLAARTIRDLATDYLQFIQTRFRIDRAMTPVIRRVMENSGSTRIIDLCSGGSGPADGASGLP